ncbi:hypothetical protein SLA2020_229550 [Shorea laevis]
MEEKLATAEKKVLVELVKLAQKRGLKGTQGDWKEFLNINDRKFGSSLSDPSKRSNEFLVSFLKTFTAENDLKFFDRILQCHSNRRMVEQFRKESPDNESPEQRLVRLTLEHPLYPLDYTFPSHEEGWVVAKLRKKSKVMRSNEMVAVDCEMVLCEDGTEALVKVCVVDRNLEVKLNKLVNPNKAVADFRTEITGVTATDLNGVTCSLADIQKPIKKLLSHGAILVGHGLNNDLRALKLDHARIIDTSYIFRFHDAPIHRRPSLNNLCKSVLGFEVQEQGSAHNCVDDACAAMKLVLSQLEHGDDIMLVCKDAPQAVTTKLLLHRIPINISSEELYRVIPRNVNIEVKPSKNAQGEMYSAFAIFKTPQEACQVFENLEASEEKDSSGRPQKLVRFQTSTGVTADIYIRKMANDDSHSYILAKKRALPGKESSNESKKPKSEEKTIVETTEKSNNCLEENELLKDKLQDELFVESMKQEAEQKTVEGTVTNSNQTDDLLKEIERLKQELREKDLQINLQDKIIASLERKVQQMKKGLSNVIMEL